MPGSDPADTNHTESGLSASDTAIAANEVVDSSTIRDSLLDIWRKLPGVGLRLALIFDAAFLALYVAGATLVFHNANAFFLVNLEGEGNPPSWWYGSQQLLVALVFLLLASRIFAQDTRLRPLRTLFLATGLGFGFISFDEVGEFHEIGSRILIQWKTLGHFEEWLEHTFVHIKHRLHGGGLWVVVYAVIGIGVIIWLTPHVIRAFRIWPKQVVTMVVGFGIFIFSAVVLQVVGYFTKPGTLAHFVYVFTEQGLKMLGISIALFAGLQVLAAGLDLLTRQLASQGDAQSR